MTTLINADGEELDYIGNDIGIVKQAINVYDFKIKGSFSKTFSIPNNAHNRRVLDYYGSDQLSSGALRKQSFSIVRAGAVLLKGDVIVDSSDNEKIDIYFVSGNSSWFNLFQFNCKDIRETKWNTVWRGVPTPYTLRSRDQGIVFPFVDWAFAHAKANKYFHTEMVESTLGERPGSGYSLPPNEKIVDSFFPCVYLKTLLNEIFIYAGVKLSGNILTDTLYNSLILTHDGPDMINPETNTDVNRTTDNSGNIPSPTVSIATMAPNIKAIELIKWVCVTFGAMCNFNDTEKTLELNLIDKFNIQDADDWSQYFLESESDWSQVKATNIIKTSTNEDDPYVEEYNKNNVIKFGELGIESGKDDGSERTVYTSPFPVTRDARLDLWGGDAFQNIAINIQSAFVPFFTLEDDEVFEYTSVVNTVDTTHSAGGGTLAGFTGTGYPWLVNRNIGCILRLEDYGGVYTNGYYVLNGRGVTYPNATGFELVGCEFTATSTGRVWTQRVRANRPGVRALIHVPNVTTVSFAATSLVFGTASIIESGTEMAYAYAVKSSRTYSALNPMAKSMSYGEINEPFYTEPTLEEINMKVLSTAIKNPLERTKMLLPFSVFHNFKFDKFIFLKTERLNGYFIVNKIENYIDGSIPVKVELVRAL